MTTSRLAAARALPSLNLKKKRDTQSSGESTLSFYVPSIILPDLLRNTKYQQKSGTRAAGKCVCHCVFFARANRRLPF